MLLTRLRPVRGWQRAALVWLRLAQVAQVAPAGQPTARHCHHRQCLPLLIMAVRMVAVVEAVEEGMAAVAEGMAAVVEGMAAAMVKGMAAVAEGMVEMLVVAMVEGMAAVAEGMVETLVVAMVEEGMAAVLWPKRRPRRKPVRGVARRGARSSSQESILQARRLDGGQFAPST